MTHDEEGFKRKRPDEILRELTESHKGYLKVLVGPVSGSGKTYRMLQEGQRLKGEGIDVVTCAVSTSARPQTREQMTGLERIPSLHWEKEGELQKDLDLEEILKRNPEVLLTDNLAHRNREGAKFSTRYEEILFLITRGISVITTLNIYQIEEISAEAEKRIGVKERETLPYKALEAVDELQLIDVSTETMLHRWEEGALINLKDPALLKEEKIGILREMALRFMAEGINEDIEHMGGAENRPIYVGERVLVATQYHWNGSVHILHGNRIAKRLGGELKVATFVKGGGKVEGEAAVFRRNMRKLVKKLGASFEEIPFTSFRLLPYLLLRYAKKEEITSIVIGHSKQTLWQEIWRGSLAYTLIRKMRGMDLILLVDRSEAQGERIFPTKYRGRRRDDVYRRYDKVDIHPTLKAMRRGRLKIYIGAAPGVGKTYMMLREGNILLKKGIHIVIGLLETHGRKETEEQAGALPIIPRKEVAYKGITLKEMDTEAIIRQNPEVVLIDELAHTNVPGSKNRKRYEDVMEILEAGISVISTMNVQHLESLNDAVAQITGVRVQETIPDSILHEADELELIDVSPKTLQQRMREGRIYAKEKIEQALSHFFKTRNLIALRELALREIADDVDERLEERGDSLRGPWRKEEVVFVCITTGERAEKLIRRGFRIALRLKAKWFVLHVETSKEKKRMDSEREKRIEELRSLSENLEGTFLLAEARNKRAISSVMIKQTMERKATQLIVGQSKRSLWERLLHGSISRFLLRNAREMDLVIVGRYEGLEDKD